MKKRRLISGSESTGGASEDDRKYPYADVMDFISPIVSKPLKRSIQTQTIAPAPLAVKEEAADTSLDHTPADTYSAFAGMALSKMRELPKETADDLLWTLNECLTNFCRANSRRQTPMPPVRFVLHQDKPVKTIRQKRVRPTPDPEVRPVWVFANDLQRCDVSSSRRTLKTSGKIDAAANRSLAKTITNVRDEDPEDVQNGTETQQGVDEELMDFDFRNITVKEEECNPLDL